MKTVSTVSVESPRLDTPSLPSADIRSEHDSAVRRGWAEVLRRALRIAVLWVADSASAIAAFWVTVQLPISGGTIGGVDFWTAALFASCFQPVALTAVRTYTGGLGRVHPRRLVRGVLLFAVPTAVFGQITGLLSDSGLVILPIYILLCASLTFGARSTIDRMLLIGYRYGLWRRRVVVVTSSHEFESTLEDQLVHKPSPVAVVERIRFQSADPGYVRWMVGELEQTISRTNADWVIVASHIGLPALEAVAHMCFKLGVTLTVYPRTLDGLGGRIELREIQGGVLIQVPPPGFRLPQLAAKRAIDVLVTSAALLLIWPLCLMIAVLIKLDSAGPVFFKQVRAGVGGQPFEMYKFRTMVRDADRKKSELAHLNQSGDPRLFKIKNDPRITRVGRLLRKTSLDELPQLLNVLRGDMSLVGPRPFFPGDLETYEAHHFERLFVLPGITGLWQVSGRSDVVDFEEVVRLDADYIRNWSLGRDFVILLRTLPAAFGRGGAY